MFTFVLALFALIIAVMHGRGRSGRYPLCLAVALVALGEMIPWLLTMSLR